MITARIAPDLEKRVGEIAEKLTLSASDLVRIGLGRIVEEFEATGSVSVRPQPEPSQEKEAA